MDCKPPPAEQLLPPFLPDVRLRHSPDTLSSITPPPMAAMNAISGEIFGFVKSMHANCMIPFHTDPGFTERAARYSSFSSCNYREVQFENVELSRVSSSQSLKSKTSTENRAQLKLGDAEFGNGREESSVTDPGSSHIESNARKRKWSPKNKEKVADKSDFNSNQYRSAETDNEKDSFKLKEAPNGKKKKEKGSYSDFPEPPKDYIHVRARRGQATDSHSLAERVRREKIGQRMKLLQDLVPGCNKITGKALMLDEIINYVQSLQRQVEFLSIKLATLTPRLDSNLANLISLEPDKSQANASITSSGYPLENLSVAFPFSQSKEGIPLHLAVTKGMETLGSLSQMEYTFYQTPSMHPNPLDIFGAASSQLGNLWDDELHSIVQMSLLQN